MSRVMEAWEQVLRDAISSDYDEQQFALLQIGMVLQRHNPHISMEVGAEEDALSRELMRLSLNEQRQSDAIQYLVTLVRNHPKNADTFLYALSNAQAKLLAEPLAKLMLDLGKKFSTEAIFQSLMALDGVVKQADEAIIANLTEHDLVPLLDDWSENGDSLIANKADVLADKIIDLTDDEDEA
ncbi:MAG: hypothetical protein AAFV93_25610 [Chloroflexota bacterium]